MTILKPVSAFERGLLEALGETPAQHQQQVLAARKPSWLKGKKNPRMSAHEVYLKLQESPTRIPLPLPQETSSADLVANLVDPNWQADAYILFRRHQTCRHCRRTEDLQDSSQLFLRWRRRTFDAANSLVYTPVKSLLHQELPRRVQVVFASTPVCLSCFSEATCQSTSIPSRQGDTNLSPSEGPPISEKAQPFSSDSSPVSESPSDSSSPFIFPAPTMPHMPDGLPALVSTTFLDSHITQKFDSVSEKSNEPVGVQPELTLTDTTGEPAPQEKPHE